MGYHPLPADPIDPNVKTDATIRAAGSCADLATSEIYGRLGNYFTANDQLRSQLTSAYTGFETSETGIALGAGWSACMARSGYDFNSPQMASLTFSQEPTLTPEEIAARLTDLECDVAVGYTQSRHDWEAVRVEDWRAGADDAIQAAIADRTTLAQLLSQLDTTLYCKQVALLDRERPEEYVGSAEHQADVANLTQVAPDSAREPLTTFAEFLGSGAITAANPDSNLTDTWPSAVQEAVREITAYNSASC